jgi:hypothetical protein
MTRHGSSADILAAETRVLRQAVSDLVSEMRRDRRAWLQRADQLLAAPRLTSEQRQQLAHVLRRHRHRL